MRVELPDVRAQIAAHDDAEKPALIIMDGVGIGLAPCQGSFAKAGSTSCQAGRCTGEHRASQTIRFHTAMPALCDGLVCIPDTMPGLEALLAELAAFPDGKER
jgi:hypothetical protein